MLNFNKAWRFICMYVTPVCFRCALYSLLHILMNLCSPPSRLLHQHFPPKQGGSWLLPDLRGVEGLSERSYQTPSCPWNGMFRRSLAGPCREPNEAGPALTLALSGAWFWLIPGWSVPGLGLHPGTPEPRGRWGGWPSETNPLWRHHSRPAVLWRKETNTLKMMMRWSIMSYYNKTGMSFLFLCIWLIPQSRQHCQQKFYRVKKTKQTYKISSKTYNILKL